MGYRNLCSCSAQIADTDICTQTQKQTKWLALALRLRCANRLSCVLHSFIPMSMSMSMGRRASNANFIQRSACSLITHHTYVSHRVDQTASADRDGETSYC
eukprot:scaffold1348_cov142-Skeletonema_marinoi.AAC.3